MDLRDALAALRAGWWLLVLGLLVGGGAALGLSQMQTPLYTSATQLFVSTNNSDFDAFEGSLFSQQRVSSYARLLSGEELGRRVIDRLNLEASPAEVSAGISAEVATDTVMIDVTVTDPAPQRAQQIAEAIGVEFPALIAELETPEGEEASPVKVTVTEAPDVATSPSSPPTARNVALGLVGGLLVGAALAVLRAQLDRSVKDGDEAAGLVGAPVIGMVIRDASLEKGHVIGRRGGGRAAEDYRRLRTNLQFLNVDEPPKVIMVSSALPSEGKTTLVVNLAATLADAGKTVTIVEADLRRPKVTRYLGLVGGAGLTNILAGTADLEDVVQTYGEAGISVVGAGPMPPNPGELLGSSHMITLLDKLRGHSDYVLVDVPPLLPVADASAIAAIMDGVLLSVRYGRTTKAQLQQTASTLDRVGAKLLGLILNIVPSGAPIATASGYGYDYTDERASRHGT